MREKQKALKKSQDDEDRLFEEKTGQMDESKNFSMENLIKKYEYDMR